jgi:23S rRNA pseudouridine1911/1915/1917 synthase
MQMAVFADPEIGKPAITHYQVLERFGYVTLISCQLETGRTHQIRAHLHRDILYLMTSVMVVI